MVTGYRGTYASDPARVQGCPTKPKGVEDPHSRHLANIIDCVKSRQEPRAPVEVGNSSAVLCHIANAMIRLHPETGPCHVAKWVGNLTRGFPVGDEFDALTSDPKLSMIAGLLRPDSTGPAANAAVLTGVKVIKDIDGQTRPETNTAIGADEVSGATGEISSVLLTPKDVGVSFLRGKGPT